MRKVYLDYASAAPLDGRVFETMQEFYREKFGNPSSLHEDGRLAKKALGEARASVASFMNAEPQEIIFTSGATESNNLAVLGAAQKLKRKGKHVIFSSQEHISNFNLSKRLAKDGFEVSYLPNDGNGLIKPDALEELLRDDTILVSIIHASPETGTIQPTEKLAKLAKEKGAIFHTDADASAPWLSLDTKEIPADLVTFSSGPMYGPKGVGALYVQEGTGIVPQMLGGGQERGLRSGTENLPAIVGFGKATEIVGKEREGHTEKVTSLRDRLIGGVMEAVPEARLNGHRELRLPNNASFRFPGVDAESVIYNLDTLGIQVSTGTVCTSKTLQASRVLLACGIPDEEALGTLLLSLGRETSGDDIDYVLDVLPEVAKEFLDMTEA